jgi:SAM-dependent methyltransferase
MSSCAHCEGADTFFGRWTARRELRRYRRRGPAGATRALLRLLEAEPPGDTLLDIGGGIGALQHELLQHGVSSAVHVDASTAYLQASREEAARRGHANRVEYRYGDFVELAGELPDFDVVTLDRVVCCYPDMPRLVGASAARARRLYALTYPRERWMTRVGMRLGSLWFRLRGSAFRTYLHPPEAIDAEIRRQGLERVGERRTFLWQAALYRRTERGEQAGPPPS